MIFDLDRLYLYISTRLICVLPLSSSLQSPDLALSCISFFLAYHISIILNKSILLLFLSAFNDAGDFFHYISFAAYSLLRTLLYCFIFPYLEDIFGTDYYDVLIGVMFAASGALGLLQIPLYVNILSGVMFIGLYLCSIVVMFHYYQYWCIRKP